MESFKDPNLVRMIILDHYENPQHKSNYLENNKSCCVFHNKSSTCMDDLTLYVIVEDDVIKEAKFNGIGCTISTSSTDILISMILNKNLVDAKKIIVNYSNMINGLDYDSNLLDELNVFCNVNKQPNRINCALSGSFSLINIIDGFLKNK